MKKIFDSIVGWPLWVKLLVIAVSLGLVVAVALVYPQGQISLDQSVLGDSNPQTNASVSPTPGTTATDSANQQGGSQSDNGSASHNTHEATCDAMINHGNIPAECIAGYKPPRIVFDSVTCEPAVTAGTFTITLTWKTVGGKFTKASIMSRDADGPLREKWLLAGVTADTVLIDGRQVRVRFASMNGERGYIDSVKSDPTGHVVAADVCPLG
jgi:hypothetical protein